VDSMTAARPGPASTQSGFVLSVLAAGQFLMTLDSDTKAVNSTSAYAGTGGGHADSRVRPPTGRPGRPEAT
jgi:hypothetical protein